MNTINAQTIINQVMAAHAIAPSEYTWGDFITFKTSARGSHRVLNCKENLQRFADLVRKEASAFGGGLIREAKARPAVSYASKTISLYKQLIEDRDYFAALQLAEEKLSPLFFLDHKGNAHMVVAPMPLEDEPRFVSTLSEDGRWAVIEPVSMLAFSGDSVRNKRSRDAQVEHVMQRYSRGTEESKEAMFSKAYGKPTDQASARAQWMAEHGIVDDAAIEARIEENAAKEEWPADKEWTIEAWHAAIESKAAQDVAEVVAQAVAVSAISEAMAPAAEDSKELVTCEAGESEAQESSTGNASVFTVAAYNTVTATLAGGAPTCTTTPAVSSEPPATRPMENTDAKDHITVTDKDAIKCTQQNIEEILCSSESGAWILQKFTCTIEQPTYFYQVYYSLGHNKYGAGDYHYTVQEAYDSAINSWARQSGEDRENFKQIDKNQFKTKHTTPAMESTPEPVAPVVETEAQEAPDTLEDFTAGDGVSYELCEAIERATTEQVQAMTDAQFQKLYDHLENWNFHTENYLLEALRLGDESIIADMRQVIQDQKEAGYLRSDIHERRMAICERMNAAKQANSTPEAEPVPVVEIEDTTPAMETRNIWIPKMTVGRLEKLLSKERKNGNDIEDLKDYKYFLLTDTQSATEKGFMDLLQVDGGSVPILKNKFWLTNIENAINQATPPAAESQPEPVAPVVGTEAQTAAKTPDDYAKFNIRAKSGAWFAFVYMIGTVYGLRFEAKGMAPITGEFTSHQERMAALEMMANAINTPPDGGMTIEPVDAPTEAHTPPVAECTPDTPPMGSRAEFERIKPFNMDPRKLLEHGVQAAQLIGLGVKYTGNMASPDGQGAITSVDDNRGDKCGSLSIICTLEDGRVIHATPFYFTAELRPICQFDGKMHGAPYLAELAMAATLAKSQRTSAEELKKQAHAQALIDLAAKYPQLKRADSTSYGGTFAAKNIRILLKEAFKGQKFSVTSDYSKVSVNWIDGPTDAQVTEVIGQFDIGHSDTQTDYFYTKDTAFSQLFGGVQYLSTSRETSDALIQQAINQLYQNDANRPTVNDWRKQEGIFSWNNDSKWNECRRMRDTLAGMSAYKGKAKA